MVPGSWFGFGVQGSVLGRGSRFANAEPRTQYTEPNPAPRTLNLEPQPSLIVRLSRSQTQLVQFVVQRLQADAQNLGRARFVVARVLERHLDQTSFRFFDRRAGR